MELKLFAKNVNAVGPWTVCGEPEDSESSWTGKLLANPQPTLQRKAVFNSVYLPPPPPTIQAPRIAYRTAKSDWQFAQTNCSCRNKLAATCRKVTANQQAQVVVAVAAAATARFPVWLLFDGLLKPVQHAPQQLQTKVARNIYAGS